MRKLWSRKNTSPDFVVFRALGRKSKRRQLLNWLTILCRNSLITNQDNLNYPRINSRKESLIFDDSISNRKLVKAQCLKEQLKTDLEVYPLVIKKILPQLTAATIIGLNIMHNSWQEEKFSGPDMKYVAIGLLSLPLAKAPGFKYVTEGLAKLISIPLLRLSYKAASIKKK